MRSDIKNIVKLAKTNNNISIELELAKKNLSKVLRSLPYRNPIIPIKNSILLFLNKLYIGLKEELRYGYDNGFILINGVKII